jgi:hypothetical protein
MVMGITDKAAEQRDADEVRAVASNVARPSQLISVFDRHVLNDPATGLGHSQ